MILDILNEIARTGSTNAKLELLKAQKENEMLKRIYRLTYHPQIQFGIKKVPDFETDLGTYQLEEALDFMENHLATRKCTGHNAINRMSQILSGLRKEDSEVIARIIKRDLECGASSTMANKVWKDLIPKQPQMLAQPYSEKAIAKIKFPAIAQLKADGARCFAEIRGYESRDDVKMYSRAGNEYQGLDGLKDELMAIYKKLSNVYPNGITIDGELVSTCVPKEDNDPFAFLSGEKENTQTEAVVNRQTSNGLANKALKGTITESEANTMSFQVWDIYSNDIAYGEKKSDSYEIRFDELEAFSHGYKKIIIIESQIVENISEARAVYQKYLDKGLEGIILKNIDGKWEDKRSNNQVKFKDEIDIDLRIVDFIVHSKDDQKVGSFLLESDCGKIKVKSGSGLRDTDQIKTKDEDEFGESIWVDIPITERHELNRAKLFTEIEEHIANGLIVELVCNGYTTAEGRTDSVSLFLPIIKRLRFDKDTTNTFAEKFPDSKFFEGK